GVERAEIADDLAKAGRRARGAFDGLEHEGRGSGRVLVVVQGVSWDVVNQPHELCKAADDRRAAGVPRGDDGFD
ncbi:hypothetical protein, partial [Bradyrhizobium sp.]|uniref:hypothetical protein n=1 Tax=Bradyrhizobium sp. TaxID=376 RepID=UPI0028FFEF34